MLVTFRSAPMLALLFAVAAAPALSAAAPAGEDPVVARVDGVELHRSDVEAAIGGLPPQAQKVPMDKLYPILLDRLVDGALITEAARKAHLENDPQVQRQIKRDEDRIIEETYLRRAIDKAATEDKLKADYQTLVKKQGGEQEVHARHILVKTEDEAKSIIGQLEKGGDFAALAKKYSTDPGGAGNGGDLGYFGRNDMVPAFAEAAFSTPVGQYTKKPVKTQFGWHVIQVLDRRAKPAPSFEQARPQLRNDIAHQVIESTIVSLRKNAKIETFDINGKPLPAAKPAAK